MRSESVGDNACPLTGRRESLVAFQVSLRGQGEADFARRVPGRRIEEGARQARRYAQAGRRWHRSQRRTQAGKTHDARCRPEYLRGGRARVVREALAELGR